MMMTVTVMHAGNINVGSYCEMTLITCALVYIVVTTEVTAWFAIEHKKALVYSLSIMGM